VALKGEPPEHLRYMRIGLFRHKRGNMIFIYALFITASTSLLSGELHDFVTEFRAPIYFVAVVVGVALSSLMLIIRHHYGYKCEKPLLVSAYLVLGGFGIPFAIMATHTRGEFAQYTFGNEMISLFVLVFYLVMGFSGRRDTNKSVSST